MHSLEANKYITAQGQSIFEDGSSTPYPSLRSYILERLPAIKRKQFLDNLFDDPMTQHIGTRPLYYIRDGESELKKTFREAFDAYIDGTYRPYRHGYMEFPAYFIDALYDHIQAVRDIYAHAHATKRKNSDGPTPVTQLPDWDLKQTQSGDNEVFKTIDLTDFSGYYDGRFKGQQEITIQVTNTACFKEGYLYAITMNDGKNTRTLQYKTMPHANNNNVADTIEKTISDTIRENKWLGLMDKKTEELITRELIANKLITPTPLTRG